MGKTVEARQLWTCWLNESQRQTTVCVYKSRLELFEAWLTVVAEYADLRSLVIQRIARLMNQPSEQLASWLTNTSEYQIQLFWQRVAPLSDDVAVLQSLLASLPTDKALDRQSGGVSAKWLEQTGSSTILQSFATVAQLLPPSSVPGLLVLLPNEGSSAISSALNSLTQLVEHVPVIPVGLVLTESQGKVLLNEFSESRAKAMLRSGLIKISFPTPVSVRQWFSDRGIEDEPRLQPILRIAEKHGLTTEALETALALVNPTSQPNTSEADKVYRSQAERFLSQFLEANPSTAGRFKSNVPLEITFGNRRMEVDFLDAEANIVIELDGHYHFGSLDDYRRDRRKDRLLQQQGFLVLRFLAEDVVRDLEDILDAVDQALASRKSLVTNHLEA